MTLRFMAAKIWKVYQLSNFLPIFLLFVLSYVFQFKWINVISVDKDNHFSLSLQIFPIFFAIISLKAHFISFIFCTFATASAYCGSDAHWGARSRWVGLYIVEKRHCTLCFWLLERRKLKISIKDKRRGDAYGCVYDTQPECAEGLLCVFKTYIPTSMGLLEWLNYKRGKNTKWNKEGELMEHLLLLHQPQWNENDW